MYNITPEPAITLEIQSILQEVTVLKGYLTDAGTNVYIWRSEILPESVNDAIIIRDKISNNDDPSPHDGAEYPNLDIEIGIGCRNKADLWMYIHNALQDVRKCIGKYSELLYNKYQAKIELIQWGVVNVTTSPETFAEASIILRVNYLSQSFLTSLPLYSV